MSFVLKKTKGMSLIGYIGLQKHVFKRTSEVFVKSDSQICIIISLTGGRACVFVLRRQEPQAPMNWS